MNKLYPWQKESWQRWAGLRSRLPHAILLKGPQGIGKFDFAKNLAQSLLCEQPLTDGLACQNCPSCLWFQQETHPDFRLLQPDSLSDLEEGEEREAGKKKPSQQISVDQIRGLANFANLSSHRGGHRVVLIHPAEAMNTNAANALLKTLEEPSDHFGQPQTAAIITHYSESLHDTCHSYADARGEQELAYTAGNISP